MKHISRAAQLLEGQQMFQILAKARSLEKEGRKIHHFEIGDPDYKTPEHIVNACIDSLNQGNTHYSNSKGIDEFINASRKRISLSRGFIPENNQILVTAGANVQIFYSLACLVNPGEEVITIDPCFVSYRSIMKFLGIVPRFVRLKDTDDFELDPREVKKSVSKNTRAILINSPHNPTGAVLSEEKIREIYKIAEENDLYLISDEVYGRMVYKKPKNGKFFSPSSIDKCRERTVIIHSLSKSYAMTGWRIGAVTGPADVVERMNLLLETTSSCVSPFIQVAAARALEFEQTEITKMVESLENKRDTMVALINQVPNMHCNTPAGAFYIFANIKATGYDDIEFSNILLDKVGLATCPGTYFGDGGRGFIRFCFANSLNEIEDGISKLIDFYRL